MTTRISGRHRAAVRPKTPLTALSEAVLGTPGTAGRRCAVLAASSGLVLTIGLPVASAAPIVEAVPAATSKAVTAPAPQVETAVSVPADAQVSFATSVFGSATPPPPPPPPVVEERTTRASRSSGRESLSGGEAVGAGAEVQHDPAPSGSSIVDIASQYIGTMYVYGGTTPAGFDCSGFTQYVYAQVGISIPRTSSDQAAAGRQVSASEARPGDLVWAPGHIGIYVGGNQMIDSPRTGKAVAIRDIWYTPTFIRYGS